MKKKRIWKRILLAVLVLLLAVLIALGGLYLYSDNYAIPKQDASIENATGLVQAHGRSLYDAQGKQIQLIGVNAGQILLQESWMSPFALEPLKNEDDSYAKDKDGNLQYPEFSEEDFRHGVKSNPNLNTYAVDKLMAIYWNSFFGEEDFQIIKEELGLNAIRLPFYYLNLLNEDLTLKSEEDAFAYLDWFMEQAARHELYVVLDLHGAPGGQNGYEHSGTHEGVVGLWNSEENIRATVALWDFVSQHYTETRPDLGKWIATYDLLNEPNYKYRSGTTRQCWDVMDRIYDAIRANGDQHVITMEGCWEFDDLPNPKKYGWENVQYEYHWYNWKPDLLPYGLFYMYQDFFNLGRDYDVPVLIGEFTLFDDSAAWEKQLQLFDARNYSWTVWNYKTTVTGWWTSSWGVYTCQLNCDVESEETKCNISTCTYEEYVATCEKTRTEHCATGTLYNVLMDYKNTGTKD